ncbi:MAG: glycosyl transferase [Nitrospirales bacterium]|nr:MAG: glycosyl transferase [Nitrospirales bacterium]
MSKLVVKRLTDVVVSIIGLLLSFPISILIMVAIVFSDFGPIFYWQERIGKDGEKFFIWKFRTMRTHQSSEAGQITYGSRDPRITSLGYYLRMLKLDELPQLVNVLKGDMSLVGPRPEVEKYVCLYTDEQRKVLRIRPGCTDITIIRGHLHDAALLDDQLKDPERYYIETLMPLKLSHNLYYLAHQSFLLDLKILGGTILLLLGIKKNRQITAQSSVK